MSVREKERNNLAPLHFPPFLSRVFMTISPVFIFDVEDDYDEKHFRITYLSIIMYNIFGVFGEESTKFGLRYIYHFIHFATRNVAVVAICTPFFYKVLSLLHKIRRHIPLLSLRKHIIHMYIFISSSSLSIT